MASLLADLGAGGLRVTACADSSTAKSLAERQGLGDARHMAVRLFWLEACVQSGQVSIKNIKGTENPADALTNNITH